MFGRKQFTAGPILEASLRKDTKGKELSSVILACCGNSPTAQSVGTYLKKIRGVEFLGLKLQHKYSTDRKIWLYCIEAAGDAQLKKDLEAAKDHARVIKQQLESQAHHRAKLAAVPALEPMQFTIADVTHALKEYQRKHGPDRTKQMFRELTGLAPDLDLLPVENYRLVVERCLAREAVAKPEPKIPAPANHRQVLDSVMRSAPQTMVESATPKLTPIQQGLTARVPGWQRRGESSKPNTMPFRVHPGSPISNARQVVHTEVNWSPHSIFRR